jgi:hypothetical protein
VIFAYRRGRWAEDAVLAAACALTLALGQGPFAIALSLGCAAVLAWGVATIHFPSRVEITPEAIAFHGYGRAHVFAWDRIARLRVRRFLVKDRVLVRVTPAGAWRGRYWLTDAIEGYPALVEELERRAKVSGSA